MRTYIALLRGINVSGQKIIKMELLRKVLAELDFQNISTYIQSGNILFESPIDDSNLLEKQIAGKIEEHFGFTVPVRITTLEELKTIVAQNPFVAENLADPKQPYVAFLSDEPARANLAQLHLVDFQGDRFIAKQRVLYLCYAQSVAETKLSNVAIEKKLKLTATSRNWKTVLKLIELTQKTN